MTEHVGILKAGILPVGRVGHGKPVSDTVHNVGSDARGLPKGRTTVAGERQARDIGRFVKPFPKAGAGIQATNGAVGGSCDND